MKRNLAAVVLYSEKCAQGSHWDRAAEDREAERERNSRWLVVLRMPWGDGFLSRPLWEGEVATMESATVEHGRCGSSSNEAALSQKPNGVEGRGREPLGTSDKNCGKDCLFSVTCVLSARTVKFSFTVSETRFLVCQWAITHRRQLLLQRFYYRGLPCAKQCGRHFFLFPFFFFSRLHGICDFLEAFSEQTTG